MIEGALVFIGKLIAKIARPRLAKGFYFSPFAGGVGGGNGGTCGFDAAVCALGGAGRILIGGLSVALSFRTFAWASRSSAANLGRSDGGALLSTIE
jgi:hypothetical protein